MIFKMMINNLLLFTLNDRKLKSVNNDKLIKCCIYFEIDVKKNTRFIENCSLIPMNLL